MTYYVAESYKHMERIGEPIEENGKLYTIVRGTCDRCGGTGRYGWGAIINGNPQHAGVCYKCNGSGKTSKKVRLYNEKEFQATVRARENRREKAAAQKAERKAKAFDRWLERNGFTIYGETFVVYGNTYPIKEQLKEVGYKFSKELMWHGPSAVCVPEDCFVERINWFDVYEWHEDQGYMEITEEGQKFLAELFSKNAEGGYIGRVGKRLRNVPAFFEKEVSFEGAYGISHAYTFKNVEGAQITWFTTCTRNFQEGQEYLITGTVKKQEVYRNVKTTYMSRCDIRPIND